MAPEIEEFIPEWLQDYLKTISETERTEFLTKYDEAIGEVVDQLQNLPINRHRDGTEEGHFSVRIGKSNVFVNVKKSVWTAAKYAGPLILAVAVSPALLAHLGIAIAAMPHVTVGTTGSAVAALCGAFAKLNPDELDTYQAVAAAIERNRGRVLANSGAQVTEISESFRLDREIFPPTHLGPMLDQLVGKGVLNKQVLGGVEQYFLAF